MSGLMSKLPVLSGEKLIKLLEKAGFRVLGQKGSHVIMIKVVSGRKLKPVIPLHKELKIGTLLSILHQANMSRQELENLL